jgi:hypothetical protein
LLRIVWIASGVSDGNDEMYRGAGEWFRVKVGVEVCVGDCEDVGEGDTGVNVPDGKCTLPAGPAASARVLVIVMEK